MSEEKRAGYHYVDIHYAYGLAVFKACAELGAFVAK